MGTHVASVLPCQGCCPGPAGSHRSVKEQEGRAQRRRSQMHGKVDQDKACPKHIRIYIYTFFISIYLYFYIYILIYFLGKHLLPFAAGAEDGWGTGYRPWAQQTSSLRSPGSCRRAAGSSLLPQPQKPAGTEATEQRAHPGTGRQCLPPRPGKEIPSEPDLPEQRRGASPGGSCRLQSLQNGHISSFSRACDLSPFLGQCTDGGDVSPPPPPPSFPRKKPEQLPK